jgi:hypothetical protein
MLHPISNRAVADGRWKTRVESVSRTWSSGTPAPTCRFLRRPRSHRRRSPSSVPPSGPPARPSRCNHRLHPDVPRNRAGRLLRRRHALSSRCASTSSHESNRRGSNVPRSPGPNSDRSRSGHSRFPDPTGRNRRGPNPCNRGLARRRHRSSSGGRNHRVRCRRTGSHPVPGSRRKHPVHIRYRLRHAGIPRVPGRPRRARVRYPDLSARHPTAGSHSPVKHRRNCRFRPRSRIPRRTWRPRPRYRLPSIHPR